MIENVLEELDVGGEFFFNTSTRKLYFMPNSTGSPSEMAFTVPVLKRIVEVVGTQRNPVQNVSIQRVKKCFGEIMVSESSNKSKIMVLKILNK